MLDSIGVAAKYWIHNELLDDLGTGHEKTPARAEASLLSFYYESIIAGGVKLLCQVYLDCESTS